MGNAFKRPEESYIAAAYPNQERIVKNNYNSYSASSSFYSQLSFKSNHTKVSTSSVRYSKTKWPRPSNISIFISHFKLKTSNFEYLNIIAKGSFGTVIKVYDKDNKTEKALKVLKKSFLIRENCVEQIKTEVDIHKVCSHHPFVANFSECWQGRYDVYILTEFISKGELFNKFCNFSFELIKLYVAEISLALDFLHNAGIIYRDLKPENILLSENDHIKLIDFGFSKWLKIGEKTKTICGTLQYIAPEILREEYYDHAVDWWSLGVVTCRMFTNEYPDVRKILHEDLKIINTAEQNSISMSFFPEEFQYIPVEGQDLLKRLLEFNPQFRINSVLKLKRIAFFKNFNFELDALNQLIQKIKKQEMFNENKMPIYL